MMTATKIETGRKIEAREVTRSAESAWLKSNQEAKRKEIVRKNNPIINLSFAVLRKEMALALGREMISPEEIIFPNREFKLRFPKEIELPKSVYIVGSFPLLRDIGRLQFVGDYLREKGVDEITAICSFLGFTRQDRKFIVANGAVFEEAISLKSIIRSLANSVDRLIVLDPHSGKTVEYGLEFDLPVLAISAWRYLADQVKPLLRNREVIVAGPDIGRRAIAGKLADYLGCQRIAFRKERGSLTGRISFASLTSEEKIAVTGKTIIVFDDVITQGETIGGMANLLRDYALEMIIMATHGEFTNEAAENLNKLVIRKILVTDSRLPLQEQPILSSKIQVVSTAPFLTKVIREDSHFANPWESDFFEGILI